MNVLLVIQLTVYILALVLALCISVPVIIHQQDFKSVLLLQDIKEILYNFFYYYSGHCLLFSRGQWRETDGNNLLGKKMLRYEKLKSIDDFNRSICHQLGIQGLLYFCDIKRRHESVGLLRSNPPPRTFPSSRSRFFFPRFVFFLLQNSIFSLFKSIVL